MLALTLLLSLLVNLPVGYVVWKKQSLTVPGGITTAGIMGFLLFVIHPLFWTLLIVFFGSSTVLTRYRAKDEIKQEAMTLAEKGGERDSKQVLANGGIPGFIAILILIQQSSIPILDISDSLVVALVVAFAVVNADTWATELGVTSSQAPRWILDPRRTVPRGTSGGISTKGLIASFLAASLISLTYSLFLVAYGQFDVSLPFVVILGGLLGSLIDSFLGATIQAQYQCPACKKVTEKTFHDACEADTEPYRGLAWFSNDLVNLVSVVVVVLVSLLLW
ncbi:MAG: DUF92 domain-containing protein [Candidatus Kariarchaeaceae archaeon]